MAGLPSKILGRQKEKWYAAGLAFECQQSGRCCSGAPGYVWVSKQEIEAIARQLGRADGKLDRQYLRRVGLRHSLTEKPDGDCIFLVRGKGQGQDSASCAIYSVRPTQCRTWPFWDSNLKSPDAWNSAAMNCPGMNRGPVHAFVRIEELRVQRSG